MLPRDPVEPCATPSAEPAASPAEPPPAEPASLIAVFLRQLETARRDTLALAVALDRRNDAGAVVALERVCRALIDAERTASLIVEHAARWHPLAHSMLRKALAAATPWLVAARATLPAVEDILRRFAREDRGAWGEPARPPAAIVTALDCDVAYLMSGALHGAKLVGVVARESNLAGAVLTATQLVECRFTASELSGGNFDDSVVDRCDLARANLARTSWCGARLVRSTLSGAVLVEARLDWAMFVDCDLRGADLAVAKRLELASSQRTCFVRCDLRETRWTGRMLASVRLIDCKLHGVHGAPRVDGIEIERPDLSPRGDGSELGSAADVLRAWRR